MNHRVTFERMKFVSDCALVGMWFLGVIVMALPGEYRSELTVVLFSYPAGYAAGTAGVELYQRWQQRKGRLGD